MVACRKQASSQILSSATKNKFELARFLPFSVQFFMPTNPTISYRETQKETESKIRNQRSSKEQQTTRPRHQHVICIRLPEQISVSPQPLLGSSRRVTWIYSLESRRVSYLLAQLPSKQPQSGVQDSLWCWRYQDSSWYIDFERLSSSMSFWMCLLW